jgi:hypothetical protein
MILTGITAKRAVRRPFAFAGKGRTRHHTALAWPTHKETNI